METQIRLQETKQNNLHLGEQNKLVLALMLLGILWLLSTLALLILVFNNRSLATKKSIYVQTQTGQTLKAEEKDGDYRSATVIQETVTSWIRLTFEWDVYLGADKLDPGYQISTTRRKVTSKAYAASYLMAPGFRQAFLAQLSKVIPREVFLGHLKSHVNIFYLSEPRVVSSSPQKVYEIDTVVIRYDVAGSKEAEVKWGRTLTLKPIQPYRLVLGQQEPVAFRKQLAILQKNGLMITNIKKFEL